MGRKGDCVGKNINLKKLMVGIDQFFRDNGLHEIRMDEDPHDSWFRSQAKKTDTLRMAMSNRKAIHMIKDELGMFIVSVEAGD